MIPYGEYKLPKKWAHHIKGKKNPHKVCDDVFCFDIETSSYLIDGDKIYTYPEIEAMFASIEDKRERYEATLHFCQNCKKGNVCYLWQFGINNDRVYGRTLEEFKSFFDDLIERVGMPFVVFIHNSSYEYHYLRGIFGDAAIDAFFTEPRKPLTFRYDVVEFRCTYRLTNQSLANWGKNIGLKKLDTLDYHTLYTPKSELPEKALQYAERDIEIMYFGILKYIEEYGSVWNIPLTQTGRPRRDIKAMYQRDMGHHRRITDAQPHDHNEYKMLRKTLAGGMCMAGVESAGRILYGVGGYDRASAYPYQTTTKEFPASRFRECFNREIDMHEYSYIFYSRIYNARAKTSISCISSSKMFNRNGHGEFNNGKLIKFDGSFEIFMTEIDLQTYEMFYDMEVENIKTFVATKAFLNIKYVKYILDLYVGKTSLKNVPDMSDVYMRKKEVLNSASFGMACTSLVFDDTTLNKNGEFEVHHKTDAEIDEALAKLQANIWKSSYAFSMGVWITAYQRKELLEAVSHIKPEHFAYSDTDSIKTQCPELYEDMFNELNQQITDRIHLIADHRGIDLEMYEPMDKDGKKHMLGVWEFEGIYNRSVFLGAKRYCYEQDGETHIVVAGVPKIAGKHIKIEDFKDGFIFDQADMEYKKNMLCYLDGDNPVVTLKKGEPDEWTVNQPYAICMYPIGYDMSLTKEYSNLIDLYKNRHGVLI